MLQLISKCKERQDYEHVTKVAMGTIPKKILEHKCATEHGIAQAHARQLKQWQTIIPRRYERNKYF